MKAHVNMLCMLYMGVNVVYVMLGMLLMVYDVHVVCKSCHVVFIYYVDAFVNGMLLMSVSLGLIVYDVWGKGYVTCCA